MGFIGGDIVEIQFNHPTLGTGIIYPQAKEDANIDTGGFRSDDSANGIAGNGQAIRQMSRVRWSAEATIAWDMNTAETLETLVALASDPNEAQWTISHISGAIYQGSGFPVGDLQGSMMSATFKLKLAGSNQLVNIG